MKSIFYYIQSAIAIACLFLMSCRKEKIPIAASASEIAQVVSWIEENRSKLDAGVYHFADQIMPDIPFLKEFSPHSVSWSDDCLTFGKFVKGDRSLKNTIFIISDKPGAAKEARNRLRKEARKEEYKFESAEMNEHACFSILHLSF